MITHIGRAWVGHAIEDECPCPQEPCGLIDETRVEPDCPQHGLDAGRSLRQSHPADKCGSQLVPA